MTPEGIAAVERQGFMVVDDEGDYTTPLVGDAECAYSYTENGVTLCAVERAFREAVECGRRLGIPVYKALREPIVRRFSEEFYRALEAAEEFLREQERRP